MTKSQATVQDVEKGSSVHIVGSSVNLPDMTAHLKAKVSVPVDEQANPQRLAAIYDEMAAKFYQKGLAIPAVQAMRQYFCKLEGTGIPEPLQYAHFVPPLPPGAVRLCVVFFQETNKRLMDMVHQAANEIMASLPTGTKFHLNCPSHYHITVFMTSQPHTLCPDPFVPNGGLPTTGTPEDQATAAKPAPDTLEQEISVMRSIAASHRAPELEVHRLLFADSGTLLLCSVDHSGNLARLRGQLRSAFPGAPTTQSSIMHASIARIVSTTQLTAEQLEHTQAVCDKWSTRLKGMQFNPEALYHICENTFTTVEGPKVALPFEQSGQRISV